MRKTVQIIIAAILLAPNGALNGPDSSVVAQEPLHPTPQMDIPGDRDSVALASSESRQLQADGPLRTRLDVTRWGRYLRVSCKLARQGTRRSVGRRRGDPPQLAIYRGDRQLKSGSFEYG